VALEALGHAAELLAERAPDAASESRSSGGTEGHEQQGEATVLHASAIASGRSRSAAR
jgi:hypothetical protein